MTIQIITPDRVVFEGEVSGITIPTTDGEITVLQNHIPLLTTVKSGELVLLEGSQKRHMAVHGGFARVEKNTIKILADSAELAEEIDARRAEEALDNARKAKEEARTREDQAEALASIERALTRLRLVEQRKRRHRA